MLVAVAAAFAFAVPLLAALHARVPGTRQRPLYEPRPSDRPVPFEIEGHRNPTASTEIYRSHLVVRDVAALTSHRRLLLMVATYRTVPRLLRADLSFTGIACAFHAAAGEIADNYYVVFDRDSACATPDS